MGGTSGRSHYIPRREESFDLGMGGGGSQPNNHEVGKGSVGDSEYAISSSRLLIGRLHLVPGGDRGLGEFQSGVGDAEGALRKKWDDGDSPCVWGG